MVYSRLIPPCIVRCRILQITIVSNSIQSAIPFIHKNHQPLPTLITRPGRPSLVLDYVLDIDAVISGTSVAVLAPRYAAT